MNPSKETELIRVLVEGTRAGSIAWTLSVLNKGFITEIEDFFFEIRRTPVGPLSTPGNGLVLEIRAQDGTVVDKIEAAPRDSLASMLRGTQTLRELWKLLDSDKGTNFGR